MEDLKPWAVHLDYCGGSYLTRLVNNTCPDSHVRCPNAYCIPSFTVNNGVRDCPHHNVNDELVDDEDFVMSDFSCPGHYKCFKSYICVHSDFLCDGIYHCPLQDDEQYCQLSCPTGCRCEGFALTCARLFNTSNYVDTRYLDLSETKLTHVLASSQMYKMRFLQSLNLSQCSLSNVSLPFMQPLKILDLGFNNIFSFTQVDIPHSINLKTLVLSGNSHIASLFSNTKNFLCSTGSNLQYLYLIQTKTNFINPKSFVCGDSQSSSLKFLDISGNKIEVEEDSFANLDQLTTMIADDKVLCCIYFSLFPDRVGITNCQAPEDELSSCTALLTSNFLRVCLWTLSLAALLGNGSVIFYRVFLEKRSTSLGFHSFVMSLSVSDFCMGLYLIIIGSADLVYEGNFLWQRWVWKRHTMCTMAGVLGMVSNEVSAFTICLIMLDRLLAVKFPLHRQYHFTWKSALVAVVIAWAIGFTLALTPLLPQFKHWEFFGQNAICLPLPITKQEFLGRNYARSIFLILNFVIFMIICSGQLMIYFSVQQSSKITSTVSDKDMAIARRLFVVVFSDFCCWFPVGVMGLMANAGVPIPGNVNVLTAIFVLPLNSALNPFLYTYAKYRQKREKKKDEKRYQAFVKKYQSQQKK